MPRTIRSLAVALVLLVLAGGAAHARPIADRPSSMSFNSFWEWMSSHLPVWNKAGGMMDPNGLKAGGTMDPNGNPLQLPSPSTSDAGSDMDPNG